MSDATLLHRNTLLFSRNGGLQMKIKIDGIKIGDRCRKDVGNISALADSIARNGLLQPIAITPDKRLIDGQRRLMACRDILNWDEIDVHVVDIEQVIYGELDANTKRKAFTPSEAVAMADDSAPPQYPNTINHTSRPLETPSWAKCEAVYASL
ncbi:hypothetical protein LCGC14_2404970 [marine sediment metagenome]|uniref:ParB-like N-terminal domain-containing protein n=1 Tax=marine sediment metagenome TaxID=412755 RepID=A0A0F9E6I0_9ZZZZ